MSSSQPSLPDLTVRRASELLAARRISAVELLDAVLARLDATEPTLHAYCAIDRDAARADARRADGSPSAGPLHGLPFGVKDVFWTRDLPTTCGSRSLEGWVAPAEAAALGAIVARALGARPLFAARPAAYARVVALPAGAPTIYQVSKRGEGEGRHCHV